MPQNKKIIRFTKGKYDASEGIFLGNERDTRENKRRVSAHQHTHMHVFLSGEHKIKKIESE